MLITIKTILPILGALPLLISAAPFTILDAQARYDQYRADSTAAQKVVLAARSTGCTLENVIVRKEWSTLTLQARKEYTDAVLCLRNLPPISPNQVIPGARSRFDDLHAAHINQTLWVHLSAYFLPWHRLFVHAYEKALRDECGYSGGQPYWEWSAGDATPATNALFIEPGGIGGNGEVITHEASTIYIPTVPQTSGKIPPGTGGGCILDGPFANITNNLGPQGPPTVTTAFNYNPRCVRRDFRPTSTRNTLKYENVTLALEPADFFTFSRRLDTMHSAGHAGIGGMNDDLYAGNGDPAFYFHHSQVDHVWTMWQALDLENRLMQISGTLTISNSPPSPNGTLDTTMDLGYNGFAYENGGTFSIRELASTIDGPFCYIYE
ncbi:Di-copper centre-containing protein [Amniculicola lignicola CBS 123094]|uniref:Di-copper centre-containing protein n=1 Tax=Amniculicola lignicola CBS 123094 TaxID=1392246 RepID=A0A6A5VYQ3_9PLEO|nr:Di-copper centre-containing protein [Amniculicola lignicola CBS 123094]